MFQDALEKAAAAYGLSLNTKQIKQFSIFYDLLIKWNQKMNLTTITEPQEVAVKHIIDSLSALLAIKDQQSPQLIDVGTGAGFPGIPLKILRPDIHLLLLDSLQKRVRFLKTVVKALTLEDVKCLHQRAEDAARDKNFRERFDIAIARALAPMASLAEYLLPFVRIGGRAIALKGLHFEKEVKEAAYAVNILGGASIEKIFVTLPQIDAKRTIFSIEKERATPENYPRKAGIPTKLPLLRENY